MPRYYFDIADADTVIQDQQGMELEGLEVARVEAVGRLPDFARSIPADNERRETTVEVRDASGVPLFKVTSSLVIVPFASHNRFQREVFHHGAQQPRRCKPAPAPRQPPPRSRNPAPFPPLWLIKDQRIAALVAHLTELLDAADGDPDLEPLLGWSRA